MRGAWSMVSAGVAAAVLSSAVAMAASPRPNPAELVGKDAPEVKAAGWLNAGKDGVTLADLKGKVVVVEFWATWCPPCRVTIPHLVEQHGKLKDKGLVIVSLTREPLDKIEKFVETNKMSYIIGHGSNTGGEYKVSGIPHAFVVVDGKIIWEGNPHPRAKGAELDKVIEEQLAKLAKDAKDEKK